MKKFMVILLQKEREEVTSIIAAAIRDNATTEFFYQKVSTFYTTKEVEKSFVEYIQRNEPEVIYLDERNKDVFKDILRMNNEVNVFEFINMCNDLEDFDKVLKAYRDLIEESSKAS